MRIVFLHGKESGPYGSKYRALAGAFPSVTAPDCEGVPSIEDRLDIILKHLGTEPALLVGSSYGGLAALMLYERRPDLVLGVVLCAPAVHLPEAALLGGLRVPSVTIHGTDDAVIPFQVCQEYTRKRNMPFIEVADDHRLRKSTGLMVALVRKLQSCISQA